MPYASIIRPWLFCKEPEEAHEFALHWAAKASQWPILCRAIRAIARPKPRPVNVLGLTFPNPIGLAGGMDKNAVAPFAWWAMGFGFLELGTATPLPQEGNGRPRMFRVPGEGALVNRMGFNNEGAAAIADRLAEQSRLGLRPPFPIGISLGKNKATPDERTADDYERCAALLAPQADFLSINVSSPNTPGLRELQTPAWLSKLVAVVLASARGKPVLVKVAPELTGPALLASLDAVMAAGAAGIIATNTLGTTTPTAEALPAGKSGLPLRAISRERVAEIRKHLGARAAIVGVGGIDDVPSANAMLEAGADLIQIYTGLVYRGPLLPVSISRGLRRRPA